MVDLQAPEQPPRSESAKRQVYRLLKADIVTGVFDMGEKLNENQLARRYGLGKTPVREALGMLQQERLVEALPRVGYLTSRVTIQEVDDLFELRKIVEGAAAEKAAMAITGETLRRLESFRWDFNVGDRETHVKFIGENLEFHCAIASSSGNRLMAEVVASLQERTQRLVILRLDLSSNVEDLVGEHYQILAALRERNPTKARAHMEADIAGTHQVALDFIKKHIADWHL